MNSRLKKRNPVAKEIRTPKFRQRIIPDKREEIKSKESKKDLDKYEILTKEKK